MPTRGRNLRAAPGAAAGLGDIEPGVGEHVAHQLGLLRIFGYLLRCNQVGHAGSSLAGRPIQKSAPSGSAISSRNTVPRLLPVIRLTTSPTR